MGSRAVAGTEAVMSRGVTIMVAVRSWLVRVRVRVRARARARVRARARAKVRGRSTHPAVCLPF